jgi:hypothetical protein
MDPEKNEKSYAPASEPGNVSYAPSSEDVQAITQSRLQYLKWYFTSKEGWIGDYVSFIPIKSLSSAIVFNSFSYYINALLLNN